LLSANDVTEKHYASPFSDLCFPPVFSCRPSPASSPGPFAPPLTSYGPSIGGNPFSSLPLPSRASQKPPFVLVFARAAPVCLFSPCPYTNGESPSPGFFFFLSFRLPFRVFLFISPIFLLDRYVFATFHRSTESLDVVLTHCTDPRGCGEDHFEWTAGRVLCGIVKLTVSLSCFSQSSLFFSYRLIGFDSGGQFLRQSSGDFSSTSRSCSSFFLCC